jgi:hypothetical protein
MEREREREREREMNIWTKQSSDRMNSKSVSSEGFKSERQR